MSMRTDWRLLGGSIAVVVALVGCASGSVAPSPAALPAVSAGPVFGLAWQVQLGEAQTNSALSAGAGGLMVSNTAGVLHALDPQTGQLKWQVQTGVLSTSAGSDGTYTAVVSQNNELMGVVDGQVKWRQRLPARTLATPLVAGKRVFVFSADRSVSAFDAANGAPLWEAAYRGKDALVPLQPGVLMAVGNVLLAGPAGKWWAINPDTGATLWQLSLAVPRGVNEVERLVDLIAPVSRHDTQVCARAMQAVVGCTDVSSRRVLWTKPSIGYSGVSGDAQTLYGADERGQVLAWAKSDGKELWRYEGLLYRRLGAPVRWGAWVMVPDDQGHVYVLDAQSGAYRQRLSTDGSALQGAPLLIQNTFVVQTRKGQIFAWRAQ